MDRDITVIEQKKLDLSNALVVVGFPTVGLVSTIAANYVVSSLELERIGAIYSDFFPPTAVIHESIPMPPVRIYAGDVICGPGGSCEELVVIFSEFNPPAQPRKTHCRRHNRVVCCQGREVPVDRHPRGHPSGWGAQGRPADLRVGVHTQGQGGPGGISVWG
jgi:hypothetical protein